MSALEDVIKWAQTEIPPWQGDAIRRLLLNESLTELDEEELYQMYKVHSKMVEDSSIPEPILPKVGEVSGTGETNEKIVLKNIECVENINAIPDGNILPIGHTGCTLIYGENGTGKSGYARVLKRACNARDKKEEVITNIFKKENQGLPKAQFKIDVGPIKDKIVKWQEKSPGPKDMSKISVFDSKCARILLDEKNEFQYKPYGTQVFEELASLITSYKNKLEKEKPHPKKPEIENLREGTQAYLFYENLNEKTENEKIKIYEIWTDEEEARLQELIIWGKEYKEQNLDIKIAECNNYINKYLSLLKEIRKNNKCFSQDVVNKLNDTISNLTSSKKAQKIAEEAIKDNEYPLKGVRSTEWTQLLEAAEKFSLNQAYPQHEYPYVENDAKCVLCMQDLTQDAKNRMIKFQEFVKDEIGKNLKKHQEMLTNASKSISSITLRKSGDLNNHINDILATSPEIADLIIKEFERLQSISQKCEKAIKNKSLIENLPVSEFDVKPIFGLLKKKKSERIKFEKLKKPEEVQKNTKEGKELLSKKAINEKIKDIKEYLESKKKEIQYEKCIKELDYRSVSNKGRKIIEEQSTPELQTFLKEELEFFNVRNFNVNLKARGSKGIMMHEIEFPGASAKHLPSKILSEGEQRAVSLAGFFAELKLANHSFPIVFDDPVTSLDHVFRDKIAERIAIESLSRQVIVFTHDISFLMETEKHLGRLDNASHNIISLSHKNNLPGEVSANKSWHIMNVKERLKYLEDLLNEFKTKYTEDQSEYDKDAAHWYNLFREAWETIVEEVVFNNAIKRFGGEVHTLSLISVAIEDEEYKTIDVFMSKASEWMRGHDKSKPISIHRPPPKDISTDLDETRNFIKKIKSKKDGIRERRKTILEPAIADLG